MQPSSNIPTSFVPLPRQSVPKRHWRLDFAGAFGFVAFGIFVLVSLVALSIFIYTLYLQHTLVSVQKEVQTAQQAFKTAPIQKITILNNKLITAKGLLDTHVTLSRFLDVLSADTPKNVQFNSLNVTVDWKNKTTSIKAEGIARDFNTLVVESRTLEANKNLSNIVFSNIAIDTKTGGIRFTVSGTVHKKLSENFSAIVNNIGMATVATTTTAISTTTATSSTAPKQQNVATTTP